MGFLPTRLARTRRRRCRPAPEHNGDEGEEDGSRRLFRETRTSENQSTLYAHIELNAGDDARRGHLECLTCVTSGPPYFAQ